jgi:hypothetical protein
MTTRYGLDVAGIDSRGAGDGRGGQKGSTNLKNLPILFCENLSALVVGIYGQADIQREGVAEFDTCPQWTHQECHSGLKLYFEAFRRVRAEIEVFVSNPFLKIILKF